MQINHLLVDPVDGSDGAVALQLSALHRHAEPPVLGWGAGGRGEGEGRDRR